MEEKPEKRTSPWVVVIAVVVALIVGAGATAAVMKAFWPSPVVVVESETRKTEIINAITREQHVVLLSLAIQGISERNEKSSLFGIAVPGSSRVTFLQYSFDAKLGLDGKDVRITQTGQKKYLVTIPAFVFIGHSNEDFRVAAENNGVLSWVTPEIDHVEMVNNILNDGAKQKYVTSNDEALRSQAEVFYRSIAMAIDPDTIVEFEFAADRN